MHGLAIAATVLFGLFAVLLLVETWYFRRWHTMALPIGAGAEALGYLFRYLFITGSPNGYFIASFIIILVTPNIFAYCNYATVGRLLPSLSTRPGPKTWLRIPIITDSHGVFRALRIAKFFVMADVAAFLVQVSAAAFLTSSNTTTQSYGVDVVEVGLALALSFIGLFFFVTVFVYASSTYEIRSHPQYGDIKKLYISLFATITMLLIRSIYRMVEFVGGNSSYVASHEVYFYLFDCLPMLVACGFYAAFPYGKYLNIIRPAELVSPKDVNVQMEQSAAVCVHSREAGVSVAVGE